MKDTRFFRQAELLLQIIPFFSNVKVFALKGGKGLCRLEDQKEPQAVIKAGIVIDKDLVF